MVKNRRANHIYGIQTAGGGFGGFPTGGNLKSGMMDSPLATVPWEVKDALVMRKTNVKKRWVLDSELPQHKEDMSYKLDAFSKQVLLYGMPQSTQHLSALSGKASCPETAMIPNEKPIPVYEDLKAVQEGANEQRVRADASHDEKKRAKMRRVGTMEGLRRMSELAPVAENDLQFVGAEQMSLMQFFKDASRMREQEVIDKLVAKGYTEDEIKGYLQEQRSKDIDKIAKGNVLDAYGVEQALAELRRGSRTTGTDSAGIVALGATQNVSVSKLVLNELPGALGLATRDKARGISWASGEDRVASSLTQSQPSEEINAVLALVKAPQAGRRRRVQPLDIRGDQLPFAEDPSKLTEEPPIEVYMKGALRKGGRRKAVKGNVISLEV